MTRFLLQELPFSSILVSVILDDAINFDASALVFRRARRPRWYSRFWDQTSSFLLLGNAAYLSH
jgi:hypothetical protein